MDGEITKGITEAKLSMGRVGMLVKEFHNRGQIVIGIMVVGDRGVTLEPIKNVKDTDCQKCIYASWP